MSVAASSRQERIMNLCKTTYNKFQAIAFYEIMCRFLGVNRSDNTSVLKYTKNVSNSYISIGKYHIVLRIPFYFEFLSPDLK